MIITVTSPRMKIEEFRGSKEITEVMFANTVEWIGAFAFCHAVNLKTLIFAEYGKVEVIKCYAFHNCINLDNVVLPDTLTDICEGAFMGCRTLESITLPKRLWFLGPDCFVDTAIKEVSIPATVQTMAYAFDHNLYVMHCPSQLIGLAAKSKGTHRQPSNYNPHLVAMCPATMTSLGGDQWNFSIPVSLDPSVPFAPDLIAKNIVCPIEGEVELVTENGLLREQHKELLEGKVDLKKLVVIFVHRSNI